MDLDSEGDAMLTHAAGISGAPNNNATSANTWQHRSLDGIDSPSGPGSPPTTSPNLSPTTSPRLQPTRTKKGADSSGKKSSPTKGSSPAKAKFEHIASKIGMGGSSEKKDHSDTSGGASPPAKRGWRDIWPGSSKKDGIKDSSKDDGTPGAASSPAR